MNALLTQFFGSTDPASLATVANFAACLDAYALVAVLRADAPRRSSRRSPTRPSATTVSALQSALRARYAEADWLTVVRPINDAARILQRDALVAYILQQLGDGYTAPVSHADHQRRRRRRRHHASTAPAWPGSPPA